ncbi:MAG: pyridoxine 5'-phosphate synthase [Elusimicrobia bacterium]|nr:pyridoxine 5'-phosphate synthase [Elusimicrobiota bacterium]
MSIKLGVNIDHVATLRQARREVEPDPLAAARVCKTAGADLIVTHLRHDRRHIQEADLSRLRKGGKFQLHLEMAASAEMVAIASRLHPDSVCIVPESQDEVTTRGGLDLKKTDPAKSLEKAISRLRRAGMEVSLFIDPEAAGVRLAKNLGADTVELCTSQYARTLGRHRQEFELERLELAGYLAHELRLGLHAGHGLDYHNVAAVARIPHVACLNIGFSIISRALFTGLRAAVGDMKKIIAGAG